MTTSSSSAYTPSSSHHSHSNASSTNNSEHSQTSGATTVVSEDRQKPKRRLSRSTAPTSPSHIAFQHQYRNMTPTGAPGVGGLMGSALIEDKVSPGVVVGAGGTTAGGLKAKETAGVEPMLLGMPLKYVSLVTLALQNACLTIIMHYSRISVAPTKAYSAATAVLLNELLKGSISLVIALKRIDDDMTSNPPRALTGTSSSSTSNNNNSHLDPFLSRGEKDDADLPSSPIISKSRKSYMPALSSSSQTAYAGVPTNISSSSPSSASSLSSYLLSLTRKDWRPRLARLKSELFSPDCWKLSIPAILYVIQNNLQYVAASNLDVATFQVTYQMKILTTAGFSVLLLGKRLSTNKWLALLGLAVGVGIVQIQSSSASSPTSTSSSTSSHSSMNPFKGFSAVSAACFTSGLAGVYFEKVLKGSQADLWIRNVQLSLFSLLPAILPVLLSPPSPHHPYPSTFFGWLASPFHDFNFWAWMTVSVQVFGGLVTAIVIKYSDNILKGFATSLSIVISFLASVGFFGYRITPGFVIGSSTVLAATWMYNQPGSEAQGGGGSKGRKGDGKERRIPGSPVPSDAPIIGDFRKHTPNSASNSMVNIASLLTSKFPSSSSIPTPSHHSPSANGGSNPDYGYHVNEHGLTASNNASGFYTPSGSRPPSRPPSRGPPVGLTVQTS